MATKKMYFASDFHLGLETQTPARERELRIVQWLQTIRPTTEALFLLGDIFDFWWEYKRVVPRGFVRFLAALADFTDQGIPVHIFTGNHDVWMSNYLETEIGATIHHHATHFHLYNQDFYLCHGDGLGKCSLPLRLMRSMFHSRCLQYLFAKFVHPNAAIRFGQAWSHHNRYAKDFRHSFRGDDEPVARFASNHYKITNIPYYIMGHLHIATMHTLPPAGLLLLLGDWITQNTYATLDSSTLSLLQFTTPSQPPIILQEFRLPTQQ